MQRSVSALVKLQKWVEGSHKALLLAHGCADVDDIEGVAGQRARGVQKQATTVTKVIEVTVGVLLGVVK